MSASPAVREIQPKTSPRLLPAIRPVPGMPVLAGVTKHRHCKLTSVELQAIDRLLLEALRIGPACKHRAINKIIEKFPTFSRGECWQRIRRLRKTRILGTVPTQAATDENGARSQRTGISWRPWTQEDDDKLLNWAGYEPVDKIAQRLSRSARAVRFRLCALGMSARVTDGWSLRALQKLLRVSPARLREFIGSGMLRVRDPRVTARSLTAFCRRNRASLDPVPLEKIASVRLERKDAYTWERVADLLVVDLKQIQSWISAGQLKVMDPFVTDRSFEEFCKKYASETNLTLIDPSTRKWLVNEYGLPAADPKRDSVPRAQKHAHTLRTCECGRTIAGNVYFRHVKSCKVAASRSMRAPVYELNPASRTVGVSTKESALSRHSSNDGYGSGSREPQASSK